jgi:hypothetical protein
MGVAPVTARYALVKFRGNVDAACDWLFDDTNREEINSFEAAEIENAMKWFHENFPQQEYDKMPRADDFDRKLRRESVLSGEGCDDSSEVGYYWRQESFPSPRSVPMPGRLSRGSLESGRPSVDSTDDRRQSCGSRGYAEMGEAESASEDLTDEEEEEGQMPAPPESACWDWPLSRHEKKARVQMLERQMHAADRKCWMQELRGQRKEQSRRNSSGGRLSA